MSTPGYVLGPTKGEHLILRGGSILIKVDPSGGSNNMALGTQQVPIRTGIPVHQHQEADEVLFVLEGAGFGILGDTRMPVEKGSAIFIPKGAGHGVENPDSELLLLWVSNFGGQQPKQPPRREEARDPLHSLRATASPRSSQA